MNAKKGMGDFEKYSVMVPPELDERIERAIANVPKGMKKSDLIREILDRNVYEYLGEPNEKGQRVYSVAVDAQQAPFLDLVARVRGCSVGSLIATMVSDHIQAYAQAAMQRLQDQLDQQKRLEELTAKVHQLEGRGAAKKERAR